MKVNSWGNEYDVWLEVGHYKSGGLAIQLWCDEGPFATLTVCLDTNLLNERCAAIDTNNFPKAEKFIADYNLGKFTGRKFRSGWFVYPEYEFDMDELKNM